MLYWQYYYLLFSNSTLFQLKDFKIDIKHQDQSMASSIYDECQKLFNLLQSIQNSTNIPRKAHASKG